MTSRILSFPSCTWERRQVPEAELRRRGQVSFSTFSCTGFLLPPPNFAAYTPGVIANMAFPFFRTEKLRLLLRRYVIVFVLVTIGCAQNGRAQAQKERPARPVIYNFISQEAGPIDQMIRDRYGRKYEIVEIRKEPTYAGARLTRTRFPNPSTITRTWRSAVRCAFV